MNCSYCANVLKPHGSHETLGELLTQDHVIPVSRGGQKAKRNTVPCCKSCNAHRQSFMSIAEYEHFRSVHGYRSGKGPGAIKRHERTMLILTIVEELVPLYKGRTKILPLCEHL